MSFFKKSSKAPQPQPTSSPNSKLDQFKNTPDALDPKKMKQIEGGKSEPKTFNDYFNWNSSCGGPIPS